MLVMVEPSKVNVEIDVKFRNPCKEQILTALKLHARPMSAYDIANYLHCFDAQYDIQEEMKALHGEGKLFVTAHSMWEPFVMYSVTCDIVNKGQVPLGVTDRRVSTIQKNRSLSEAIGRYVDSDEFSSPCILEWIDELRENLEWLIGERKIR